MTSWMKKTGECSLLIPKKSTGRVTTTTFVSVCTSTSSLLSSSSSSLLYISSQLTTKRYMLKEEGVKPPSQVLSSNMITLDDLVAQKNYIHWIFADVSWAVTSYPYYHFLLFIFSILHNQVTLFDLRTYTITSQILPSHLMPPLSLNRWS